MSDGSRGKPATRRTLLARRDGLTVEERAAASAAIAARVAPLLPTQPQIVALYAAKGSEVDTALIDLAARRAGLRVVYPRVVEHDRILAFHEVRRDELVPSRFALSEPRADTARVALADVALFIVPGLAFDLAGGRVGWGRGHYDATFALASPTALRVGIAFACQLTAAVPREPHDVALHYVVTETATHKTQA
jgi:5-formyltetrahydrofolate cyclo-ligase